VTGEIEAVAVDDQLGYVYYADENQGVLKYHADPEHPEASKLLAVFGKEGFEGDREGIAVYSTRGDKGYLLCVDQRPQRSVVYVFPREGTFANRHDHQQPVAVIHTDSDETDGIEATSYPLGKQFRQRIAHHDEQSGTQLPSLPLAALTARLGLCESFNTYLTSFV
jgi:3-phytase